MKNEDLPTAQDRLLSQVENAARFIAPLWPLSTSIAVNPLWDLRQMPFHEAIAYAGPMLGIAGYPSPALFAEAYANGRITEDDLWSALEESHADERHTQKSSEGFNGASLDPPWESAAERHDRLFKTRIAESVDWEVAKWCASYLAGMVPDDGPARGFYAAWRKLVVYDPGARSILGRAGRKRLAEHGRDAQEAISTCLDLLNISEANRVHELARQLARMPGWAGHAKWRSQWASREQPGPALHLLDYLAVRLSYEATFLEFAKPGPGKGQERGPGRGQGRGPGKWQERGPGKGRGHGKGMRPTDVASSVGLPDDLTTRLSLLDEGEAARVWLSAYENHYRDWLLGTLDREQVTRRVQPEAQVVFCIDTRSERLRRHLEKEGPYETLGFAGFFGLPIRYRAFGSADPVDLCPVLVQPRTKIAERPAVGSDEAADRQLDGMQVLAGTRKAFDAVRKGSMSQFVLAEAGGFVAGPIALAKTLAPNRYQVARRFLHRVLAPPAPMVIDADPALGAMSDEEQALLAKDVLTTMGLTRDFAPLVLLCGHGSTTENNPYASSLDCGACGGNRGGPSARSAAAIFNRREVRRLLAESGILVPDETLFIAGEHDTATDTVTVLDTHLVPPSHQEMVAELERALGRAGAAAALERLSSLPGGRDIGRKRLPRERCADWAQVRPEWGLARNAALIIAPRTVTAGKDLAGRCFLHSYDPEVDPHGLALEAILTAPMLVAHWINAQYYFSTVDPGVFSAGDKTAQNIVAGIGVVLGAGGDLRVGLPLQSVFDGEHAYHEPMRLLVVVQASIPLLDAVIDRNLVLQELIGGQWVNLAARENPSKNWEIRRPDGRWVPWMPAASRDKEGAVRE